MIVLRIISWVLIAVLLKSIGMTVYERSFFKANFNELTHYDSHGKTTWSDFFSPDLFADIQDYIGLPQSEYRVASVALYPTVPLYNGFYCIDGYSNNYSLEYKHAFREIITKELEKNANIADYFDTWEVAVIFFPPISARTSFLQKIISRRYPLIYPMMLWSTWAVTISFQVLKSTMLWTLVYYLRKPLNTPIVLIGSICTK